MPSPLLRSGGLLQDDALVRVHIAAADAIDRGAMQARLLVCIAVGNTPRHDFCIAGKIVPAHA
jgi:hypothetical protein